MQGSKLVSFLQLALVGTFATIGKVQGHGYVKIPASRQQSCAANAQFQEFCGGVQYEPQSVEALKGAPFHREVGADICNGGGARFGVLNEHNATLWPKTQIVAGRNLEVEWTLPAQHSTTGYYYYATKKSWNQNAKKLTKDDFESVPIHTVEVNGAIPNPTEHHTLLAAALGDRLGYAIVLAVWEIADTPNSFYNCLDLNIVPARGHIGGAQSGQSSSRSGGTIQGRAQGQGTFQIDSTVHCDCYLGS